MGAIPEGSLQPEEITGYAAHEGIVRVEEGIEGGGEHRAPALTDDPLDGRPDAVPSAVEERGGGCSPGSEMSSSLGSGDTKGSGFAVQGKQARTNPNPSR